MAEWLGTLGSESLHVGYWLSLSKTMHYKITLWLHSELNSLVFSNCDFMYFIISIFTYFSSSSMHAVSKIWPLKVWTPTFDDGSN